MGNKLWYIHTTDYYSEKKKKKLLIQSTHDFQNHYPKSKKPETKEHVQYDPFI